MICRPKGIDRDTAAEVVEELFAENDDGESPELEQPARWSRGSMRQKARSSRRRAGTARLQPRGHTRGAIRRRVNRTAL